jgi:hypothetical protein
VSYRDQLEALRARLAAVEAERDALREELRDLKAELQGEPAPRRPVRDPEWRSVPGGGPTHLEIRNASSRKVEALWFSYEGRERSAGTIVPGGFIHQATYVGHLWRVVDAALGTTLLQRYVEEADGEVFVVAEADDDT